MSNINFSIDAAEPQADANGHSTQDDYEHFLSYSGLNDDPVLRYAYFHGADVGLDKPVSAAPAERAEDNDVLAIPRWRCTGYHAETQCAFVVVDENGAWMHEQDVAPLMGEYRRLAAEQGKDRKDAERYRLLCKLIDQDDSGIEDVLAFVCGNGSGALDAYLDEEFVGIDAAMAQEAGNG